MPTDKYTDILRQYWGYPDFRGIQRQIIESIGEGQDTLGLMPTGGGKSLTFQVPAIAMEGVCIVITPLIALMKDQVEHLLERNIRAAAIYSGMTRHEIIKTLENAIFGGIKILYVSPERIGSELFQAKLKRINVSFITVDEAHCISQWGYDFRPAYLRISDIRKLKPQVPILALTATATPNVVDDIQQQLEFKRPNVFRMSFERKNLVYVVRTASDKYAELIHILKSVQGSAIVYVRSRKRCKETAELLDANGLSATFYHAGLEAYTKDIRQTAWQNNEYRVMVATNAFGMGIDKPDVRVVIHIDCPDSIEAYFQEAGRAGRDGQRAYAVLLYNDSDTRKLSKRINDNFPEKDYVRKVYEHLAYYFQLAVGSGAGHTFTFEIDKFCRTFKHFPVPTDAALHILQRAGYLEYEMEPDARARVMFLLERNSLYRLEQTTEDEENVITALLRNYGGLFSDYMYIDEGLLAQQAGLTQEQIYLILKNLSHRHILHFIPRRKTPFIVYTRDREDGERVVLSKEIYEDRKEQFSKRIDAVIAYAKNDEVCRSRQLLAYFGEKRSTDCEHCDVCLAHDPKNNTEQSIQLARNGILELLSDGEKHHITELKKLIIPEQQLDNALEDLLAEEDIRMDGNFLIKAK
ncbi:ATP-dependent DNA helicase RecQ [Prevotella sp. S7 MS 2]|uniref:RecQ family ATP-dependent DNA helicase n=1 Tax=Prevotella sp. S7 MS 2 TaxID=1287488 RepID=UPI0005147F78|nr:ATP-dependent DNA helicase RecQ [Prevotella sp. S7 MS 2]KGI59722.1 ATP-dependent DNA helicase RecQ [Prevotella sp. S7 MS 2]